MSIAMDTNTMKRLCNAAPRGPGKAAYARQDGAALVVGLLLLTVITLLAIAGMNTSSVEFVMAGNAQFHENAFQAAESGISQAIAFNTFDYQSTQTVAPTLLPGSTTDSYGTVTVPDNGGNPTPITWNNSIGPFNGYTFTITSTGTSGRGASTVHTQGVSQIAPANPSMGPANGGGGSGGGSGSGGGGVVLQ